MSLSIEDALREAGVTPATLTADETRRLDEDGYLLLSAVYDDATCERLRGAFERVAARERGEAGGRESGTRHPRDLLNREPEFLAACLHPRILAAAHRVLLRSFRLTQCAGRDPLPGFGQQGLHADWMPRAKGEPAYVATAICMLDAFGDDNGPTRLVPGTHLRAGAVPKPLADPAAHHPDERRIAGAAGSVLLFNGHLWHSGTRNDSARSRRALQCVFHADEVVSPFAESLHDDPASLPPVWQFFLAVPDR